MKLANVALLPADDEVAFIDWQMTMQAPIAKFVRTMNEVPGKFVRTLAAVKEKTAELRPSPGGD